MTVPLEFKCLPLVSLHQFDESHNSLFNSQVGAAVRLPTFSAAPPGRFRRRLGGWLINGVRRAAWSSSFPRRAQEIGVVFGVCDP